VHGSVRRVRMSDDDDPQLVVCAHELPQLCRVGREGIFGRRAARRCYGRFVLFIGVVVCTVTRAEPNPYVARRKSKPLAKCLANLLCGFGELFTMRIVARMAADDEGPAVAGSTWGLRSRRNDE
jgi:hypothetical protein